VEASLPPGSGGGQPHSPRGAGFRRRPTRTASWSPSSAKSLRRKRSMSPSGMRVMRWYSPM
jgi:hypothetical protein